MALTEHEHGSARAGKVIASLYSVYDRGGEWVGFIRGYTQLHAWLRAVYHSRRLFIQVRPTSVQKGITNG